MKIQKDRIAITGMGVISPLGNNLKEFWKNLIHSRCGIRAIRGFDVTGMRTRIGGEVDNFSPTDYMDAKTVKRCARFTQFAIAAVDQAIRDAGLEITDLARNNIGVYVGSGTCSASEVEKLAIDGVQKGIHAWPVVASIRDCYHASAFTVACNYRITGPTMTLSSACNSGANALEVAIDQMRLSKISMAIVVGTETLSSVSFKTICLSQTMSQRNHEPERASRPFDRERDGFVMSEGAGALILERLGDALARGATVYAVITGCATTNDGYSILKCEPNGIQIGHAMRKALSEAKKNPNQITYISAHGPSMPDTDRAETRAIKSVFGPHARKMHVSSIKGAIGSPIGATNILQVIAAGKSLAEGIVPPTLNLEHPDDECDLDYVPKNARDLALKCAMINSHAYGGGNSSIILEKV